MALKRRQAEASKDAANEYAAILAKRVNEEKTKKSELRSKFLSELSNSVEKRAELIIDNRASRVFDEEVDWGRWCKVY